MLLKFVSLNLCCSTDFWLILTFQICRIPTFAFQYLYFTCFFRSHPFTPNNSNNFRTRYVNEGFSFRRGYRESLEIFCFLFPSLFRCGFCATATATVYLNRSRSFLLVSDYYLLCPQEHPRSLRIEEGVFNSLFYTQFKCQPHRSSHSTCFILPENDDDC